MITDIGRRVYGTVRLAVDRVTAECFTPNRGRICVTALKSLLGDKMGPEIITSETGIADAIKDLHVTDDKFEAKNAPEMKKIEHDLIDAYYMKWIDEKIPAFGGKTPKEDARDPNSKQHLISLMNAIESKAGPFSKVPIPPIERMTKELGL